jgi:hypothetical protein
MYASSAGDNVLPSEEEQQVCRSQKNKINGKFEEKSSLRLRFWSGDYKLRHLSPCVWFANPMNEKGFCDGLCIRVFPGTSLGTVEAVVREVPRDADFCAIGSDPLAAVLEGRSFRGRTQDWIARVHSVYRDERACWIQLFKDGDATASILVRCSLRATPDHVTAALTGWAPTPALSLRVLRVMATA